MRLKKAIHNVESVYELHGAKQRWHMILTALFFDKFTINDTMTTVDDKIVKALKNEN